MLQTKQVPALIKKDLLFIYIILGKVRKFNVHKWYQAE